MHVVLLFPPIGVPGLNQIVRDLGEPLAALAQPVDEHLVDLGVGVGHVQPDRRSPNASGSTVIEAAAAEASPKVVALSCHRRASTVNRSMA
jgi:hypothetical protein